MKFKGKTLNAPNVKYAVLPREDGDLAFTLKAVESLDEFNKLCPEPVPPITKLANGTTFEDTNHKDYLKKVAAHNALRVDYMFLISISETPDLEWDTVNIQNPETWESWKNELESAKIYDIEQQIIFSAFLQANSLDSEMLDEARKRFLASQRAKEKVGH